MVSLMTPLFDCAVSPLWSYLNTLLCYLTVAEPSRDWSLTFWSNMEARHIKVLLNTYIMHNLPEFRKITAKGNPRHSAYGLFHNCCRQYIRSSIEFFQLSLHIFIIIYVVVNNITQIPIWHLFLNHKTIKRQCAWSIRLGFISLKVEFYTLASRNCHSIYRSTVFTLLN